MTDNSAPDGAQERCQAVAYYRAMRCKLPARHEGDHVAGSGVGEYRWSTTARITQEERRP